MSDLNLIAKSFSFSDILILGKPELIKVKWINIDERRIISPMFIDNLPVKDFSIVEISDFIGQKFYADTLLLAVDTKTEIVFDSETITIEPWYVLAIPSNTSFSIKELEEELPVNLYLITLDTNTSINDLTADKKKDLFATFVEWLHYIDGRYDNLAEIGNDVIRDLQLGEVKIATLYEDSFLADHSHSQVDTNWIDNDFEMFTTKNGRAVFLLKDPTSDKVYYYIVESGKLLIIKPGWSHLAYVEKDTALIGIKGEPYTFGTTDKETGIHFLTRLTDEEALKAKNPDVYQSHIQSRDAVYMSNKEIYKNKILAILEADSPYGDFDMSDIKY
jgi:hypothetical protein